MFNAILSILCFIVQNMSNKEFTRRFDCRINGLALFYAIAFTFSTLALIPAGGVGLLSSGGAWVLAVTFAITFVVTIMLIAVCMSMGPLSATVLIINMSMMIPVSASIVIWNEQLTLIKGVGILCMILVLVLSSMGGSKGEGKRGGIKWILLTLLTMVLNGLLSTQQKMLSMYFPAENSTVFTFIAFIIAGIICWAMVFFFKQRGADYSPWLSRKVPFLLASAGVGLGTAGGNAFQLLALLVIPGVVAFPLVQGTVVLMLWVFSIVLYHDKLTLPGILSLISGVAGIVMLSI